MRRADSWIVYNELLWEDQLILYREAVNVAEKIPIGIGAALDVLCALGRFLQDKEKE